MESPDTSRKEPIAAVLTRAREAGKAVYGYDTRDGRVRMAKGSAVPAEWDRICVDGDPSWVHLPPADSE